jgi:hypothetical protein
MAYWKNWLSSIKWADQSVASPVNEDSNPFGGSQNEDDPF